MYAHQAAMRVRVLAGPLQGRDACVVDSSDTRVCIRISGVETWLPPAQLQPWRECVNCRELVPPGGGHFSEAGGFTCD